MFATVGLILLIRRRPKPCFTQLWGRHPWQTDRGLQKLLNSVTIIPSDTKEVHPFQENTITAAEVFPAVNTLNAAGYEEMCHVVRCSWKAQKDWQIRVIIRIHMKRGRNQCNKYGGISLLSHPGKVMPNALKNMPPNNWSTNGGYPVRSSP